MMMVKLEPRPIDLHDGEMMDVVVPTHDTLLPHHVSSGGEDPSEHERLLAAAPAAKKRADMWSAEETRVLIGFRREIDPVFNTSKSNKRLWEQISAKMKENGHDRSPNMCTDKWRNLLKEFKKARDKGSGKMSFHKEIEELIRERNRNCVGTAATSAAVVYPSVAPSQVVPQKVDDFIQFSVKVGGFQGFDDAAIQVIPGEGGDNSSYSGKVISIKLGEYTRRIGIDGTAEAIKEAIRSVFRLRTKRAFWLEDENQSIHSISREMPCGSYTLHLDEGIAVKICLCGESDPISVQTEEKTFYTQEDFREFLARRGLVCLREVNGYQSVDTLDDLRPTAIYQGVRLLGE